MAGRFRVEYAFTSESVSEGHPDKVADQISDAVLDWVLAKDCNAKAACETLIAPSLVVVAGEFKSNVVLNLLAELETAIPQLARQVIREIGYTNAATGFDLAKCEIRTSINGQSDHINQGVDQAGGEIGAGDQGLMFGFACRETPELMPLPIALAHRLMARQAELRKSGALPWLRPDAKSQVTVRYDGTKPVCVEKVVLSTQHAPDISTDELRREVIRQIIEPVIPAGLRAPGIQYLVNPTGRFEIGGPQGDTGLTGRKIIVDTYGGSCPHGGALSPEKTRPRLTVRPLTWRVASRRTSWPPDLPSVAPSSWLMRLARQSRFQCASICTAPVP
jgi:S-adenosylmethionine synthetase